MNAHARTTVLILIGVLALQAMQAAEITGKVSAVNGAVATVATDGELLPASGDKTEIFFKLAGADDEISVATGTVSAVEGGVVKVRIEGATGEVAKDQLVRIKSEQPQTKTAAAPSTPPPDGPPASTTAYRSEAQQIATNVFTFDELPVGPLPVDAFATAGVRWKKGKGEPAIYEKEANMAVPYPHGKVLLVGGERTTALTILLDQPAKLFALYRAGGNNGASTPTWTMTAYDSRGKVVGSAGEEHKVAPPSAGFSIAGAGIMRIEITTDNRHGSGTWATWNSLPIVSFGFER